MRLCRWPERTFFTLLFSQIPTQSFSCHFIFISLGCYYRSYRPTSANKLVILGPVHLNHLDKSVHSWSNFKLFSMIDTSSKLRTKFKLILSMSFSLFFDTLKATKRSFYIFVKCTAAHGCEASGQLPMQFAGTCTVVTSSKPLKYYRSDEHHGAKTPTQFMGKFGMRGWFLIMLVYRLLLHFQINFKGVK